METKKNGGRGRNPPKSFGTMPFYSKENFIFDIDRRLKKGYFHSFAEKNRSPNLKDPPDVSFLIDSFNCLQEALFELALYLLHF